MDEQKSFWLYPDKPDGHQELTSAEQILPEQGTRQRDPEIRHVLEKLESRLAQAILYTARTKAETRKHNQV